MLLPTLLAAIAAIPAVVAQDVPATPVVFSIPPTNLSETAVDASMMPTGYQRSNMTASAGSGFDYRNATGITATSTGSEIARNGTYVSATPIAGLEGETPMYGSGVLTIYSTAYTTVSHALGGAAYPIASAIQDVTSTSTSLSTTMSCATSMGFEPVASVPTSYGFTTTTTTVRITTTTHATVTVTPTASTFTGTVSVTEVSTTTSFSTEAPTTVPTPAGFNAIFWFAQPAVTGSSSRIKRFDLEARDSLEALSLLKRQTPKGNTAGFRAYRNGTTSNIYRRFPQRLDCSVQITQTRFLYVFEQGPVETTYAQVDAATSISTVTVSSTTTVTSVVPRETIYAACQANNVVNSVEGTTGEPLIFDRVIYRPTEGFPEENELIMPKDNPTQCCVECQNTAYCAGSIYAPSTGNCHIRLTRAPVLTLPGNNSTSTNSTLTPPFLLPNSTNSALSPTGTSPSTPLTTASPLPTCTGSRGFYLGTIQGQTDFPLEYALWMSNGPCGRLSVWPVPVNSNLDTSLSGPPVKRGLSLGM